MGNDQANKINAFYLTQLVSYEKEFLTAERLLKVEDMKFPLSTERAKIIDANGKRVKLCCVNWSGAHMCRHCVDGLECRKLADICKEIRQFGFNCIRLTYSLQMYFDNPVIKDKYLIANPQMKGKRAMEIFDIVVEEITKAGIMIVMNNHISSSMWCCSTSDGQGLWWTPQYPQYKWLECLKHFAERYANNKRVIAVDLRNEIRSTPQYDPTWGDGNVLTDWRRAAILAAKEIQSVTPDVLIMIGGLNFQLDLTGIKFAPIGPHELKVQNKLVYTGHFYGFSWPIILWKLWSYQQFKQKLFQDQTFVRALGVPFFLGEFGTNTPDIPWQYLIRFLRESDIDFSYWPLDGFKCERGKDETYGIYTNDFSKVRHPWLLKDLQSLQKPVDSPNRNSFQQNPVTYANNMFGGDVNPGKALSQFPQQTENYQVPPIVAAQNTALNTGNNKVTLLTPSVQGPLQPVQLDVTTGQLSENIVQPPPPSSSTTYNNISLSTQTSNTLSNTNISSSKPVADIHASFNAGIMNLLAQSANNLPLQYQNTSQQQQPPQISQQQQQYQHQPFQPYPAQPPQYSKK